MRRSTNVWRLSLYRKLIVKGIGSRLLYFTFFFAHAIITICLLLLTSEGQSIGLNRKKYSLYSLTQSLSPSLAFSIVIYFSLLINYLFNRVDCETNYAPLNTLKKCKRTNGYHRQSSIESIINCFLFQIWLKFTTKNH